jgi:hypothetical protein
MALAARQRTVRLIEEKNQRAQQQQAMFLKPSSSLRRYVSSHQQLLRPISIIQSRQQMLSTGIKKISDRNFKRKIILCHCNN